MGPTVPIGSNRKTGDRYGGSNGGKSSLRKCLPYSGKTTRNWRQHGNRRERWNNAAIAAWRDEENRRTEHRGREKRILKDTWGEADRMLKSKLFLSLEKHGQRNFYQKHPKQKIVEIDFTELWKLVFDTLFREPNVTNRRFIPFSGKQKKNKFLKR